MRSTVAIREAGRARRKIIGVMLLALLASLTLLLGPAGVKAWAEVKKEFPVSEHSSDKLKPSVNGNIVVWEDDRDGKSNIYAKNLSTGAEFVVVSGVEPKRKPVTNGKFVVWEDDRSGNSDVYAKNLSAGEEFIVAGGPGDQRKPSISGNIVVYESRNSEGKWEVYTYDLTSRSKSAVSTGGTNDVVSPSASISGDTVVWQAPVTKTKDDGTVVTVSKIFAKNLTTGQEFQVNPDGLESQDQPSISDGIVVWRQESVANYDIFGKDLYAKNLDTGQVFQITTNEKDQVAPAISGVVVVWEDHSNDKAEIRGKNLKTGETFQAAPSSNPQTNPSISGETVVWESQRLSSSTTDPTADPNYGRYDIEGAEVEAPPVTPTGLKADGSLNGVSLKWSRNIEGDLAGYNVYRSDAANGNFVKLNDSPLSLPSFSDAKAPKGSTSFYRVTAVDIPGNESLAARDSAAAVARSSLSLSASPAILKFGARTALSGKLVSEGKPLAGKTVVFEQKPAGASQFTGIARRKTGSDGTFRLGGLRPKKNTSYRVRFAGETGIQGALISKQVRVRARVSLSKPKVDRRVNITGRVNTTRNGKVIVVVRRDGKVISRTAVRLVDYKYRSTYRLGRAGKYTVQVIARSTSANLGDTVTRSFVKR